MYVVLTTKQRESEKITGMQKVGKLCVVILTSVQGNQCGVILGDVQGKQCGVILAGVQGKLCGIILGAVEVLWSPTNGLVSIPK